MTRICMITFSPYPVDVRVRREAEALVDRGDSVDVLCLREDNQPKAESVNGVRAIRLSVGKYRGASAIMYLFKYVLFFTMTSCRLLALHVRNRYEIIQVHTMPDFLVFVALLPKLFGAKVILDVHDLMPELYRSKFGLRQSHTLIRLITWVERCSIGFADRAIAVHRPHLEALVSHGNPAHKFIILLNLPDPKIYTARAEIAAASRLGFVLEYHGSVVKRYGLHVALEALAAVRGKIKGLEFRILGLGEEIPHLTQLVKELDLSDCVSIREDMLPPEEFIPMILDADAGLVPMLDDDFTKYGLPVKLLECVKLGLPVICSRTAAIEAYFDDSMVLYANPGDADDLAEKILELYRSPRKRKELVAHADSFNRDYTWDKQKEAYYNLIDELSK